MNKFLAILKDSYKEASNTWVLQAMLVMCVLLLVFVASVSFRMIDLKASVENSFGILNWSARKNPNSGNPQYLIENLTSSNDREPWRADYAFDFVIRCDSSESLKLAEKSGLPMKLREIRTFIKDALFYLDKVKIEEIPQPEEDRKEFRYRVTSQGTKTPDRLSWQHEPSILFGVDLPWLTSSLRQGIYSLQKRLINDIGAWIILLVSVIVTAAFIPNMLNKGVLDLYISKPISRVELLVYKYLGGLLFVLILATVIVGGIWLILGLRTGIWTTGFLAMIPMLTFYFAVLYSISTCVAVLTRSSLLAILVTVIVWGLAFGFGYLNFQVRQTEEKLTEVKEQLRNLQPGSDDEDDLPPELAKASGYASWIKVVARIGHAILPRTFDLDDRMIRMIADGILTDAEKKHAGLDTPLPPAIQTYGFSLVFIAVMLGLACWRFSTRDG